MAKNNFPQSSLENVPAEKVHELVQSLRQLHELGQPQTDAELAERIDRYFVFCQESSVRPGIESLAMSCHVSRTTIFNWSRGIGCSVERQNIILSAKALISSFIEQCLLSGRINPAAGIFLAKNWMGYRDEISFEERTPTEQEKRTCSAEEALAMAKSICGDERYNSGDL